MIVEMTSTGSASGGQLVGAAAWYLALVNPSLFDCADSHRLNELGKPDPEKANGIEILPPGLEKEPSREIECAWRPEEPQSFPCIRVSTAFTLLAND
jgi:hypothetical protein